MLFIDPPQTVEDRVLAQSFMHKHGMQLEDGAPETMGVRACTACAASKHRCLVPLLSHIGHKRFRAHSCLRCAGLCSLAGTVMSETPTGGLSIEKAEKIVSEGVGSVGIGIPMVQVGTHASSQGRSTHASSSGSAASSTHAGRAGGASGSGDSDKPDKPSTAESTGATGGTGSTGGLRRMQRKPPRDAREPRESREVREVRERSRAPTPRPTSRGGSPPPTLTQLPTPRNSSPNHSNRNTGSSEGAVDAQLSQFTQFSNLAQLSSSPPRATTPLASLLGDRALGSAVGDGLVSQLQAKYEGNGLHTLTQTSLDDLGPPPARPTALASLASTLHVSKRRRLSSLTLALGPSLATTTRFPSSAEYAAALTTARTEMHAAESTHEAAVRALAEAQYASAVAAEAAARIEAEVSRISEEREAALAVAAACAAALEGMSGEVSVRKRVRAEAQSVVVRAQESVAVVAAALEERVEVYQRVVHGFIVE